MNTSVSDFSSGCESGWTQYFVKSSSSAKSLRNGSMEMMCGEYFEEERNNRGGEGEEDMSMVSDASSGPRQLYNDEEYFDNQNECSSYRNNASDSKLKKNKNGKQRDKSQLDDTASSHSKGMISRKKYFGS